MKDVDQPRPFDLDEDRNNPPLTAFEQCEADWLAANGKTRETLTAEDVAAMKLACPLYGSPSEHRERRR